MIITVSGKAGSGKSTVAKIVAKNLGYKHYSMGDLRRKMAHERNLTLAEFNKLGESQDFTDKEPDEYQKKLGKKEDNFTIDGRVSFHFIPHSFKVYLDASLDVRASRVYQSERKTEHFQSLEEVKKAVIEIEKSDSKRYMEYYNIDIHQESHYDIILNTSNVSANNIAEKIIKESRKKL